MVVMYRERTDPGSHTDRKNRTDRNEHRYYSVNVPSEKKPQECHLKKLKRTILFFLFSFFRYGEPNGLKVISEEKRRVRAIPFLKRII